MTQYLIEQLGPLLNEPSLGSGLTPLEYVEQQRHLAANADGGNSLALAVAYQNIKRGIEYRINQVQQ